MKQTAVLDYIYVVIGRLHGSHLSSPLFLDHFFQLL